MARSNSKIKNYKITVLAQFLSVPPYELKTHRLPLNGSQVSASEMGATLVRS